jgi:hypothetical protein
VYLGLTISESFVGYWGFLDLQMDSLSTESKPR